jgi:hypothetical protein
MDEGQARDLAGRIAGTQGYSVDDVRRTSSTTGAWQVQAADELAGARLTLLSEDQWDDHRARRATGTPEPSTRQGAAFAFAFTATQEGGAVVAATTPWTTHARRPLHRIRKG